jgi:hypothetical protein
MIFFLKKEKKIKRRSYQKIYLLNLHKLLKSCFPLACHSPDWFLYELSPKINYHLFQKPKLMKKLRI